MIRSFAGLFFALPVIACGPDRDFDLVPPRVLEVEPRGPIVGVDTSFRARFSEPMNPRTIGEDSVALVPRSQVSPAFLSDFENPPLSDSRKAQLVPVEVALSADELELRLSPLGPLEPSTAYTLVLSADLRDQAGNPLYDVAGRKATFRFDITTDDGPPRVVDHDLGSAQAPLVPPNRKRFSVTFDQPVRGLTHGTFRLDPEGGAGPVTPELLEVEPDRRRATLVLAAPASGCMRLTPEAAYVLRIGPGITDDEGEDMPATEIPLTTGALCDTERNIVVGAPLVVAGETGASVRFDTSKPSTTEVRFGREGGALDCLGLPCPVRGPAAVRPAAGVSPPRFVHAVELAGLEVGVAYAFQVRAEDPVGSLALADGGFLTAPLPKVAVNEVLADAPAGVSPDANGEFVELYNYGGEPVDLAGFALTLDGGAVVGGSTCELPLDGTAPVLAPGAFLVVVNRTFDAEAYGLVDESVIYRVPAGYVCGRGLANDRAVAVGLTDPDGRPVSSFGGHLSPRAGQSVERTAPDAADVLSSFCYSRSDTGPTPGTQNGVSVLGCEG